MRAEIEFPTDVKQEIASTIIEELKLYLDEVKSESDKIFSVETLSEYLNVHKTFIYDRVKKRTIPFFKIGKYNRFRKRDIDEWVDKQTFKPAFMRTVRTRRH